VKSLLPKSLPGQLAIVMAGALLVATIVNVFLVLGERQRSAFIEQTGGPIARFADATAMIVARAPASGRQWFERSRRSRYMLQQTTPVADFGLPRDAAVEHRLAEALREGGIVDAVVRASVRLVSAPDRRGRLLANLMREDASGARPDGPARRPDERALEVVLSAQLPDGRWFSSLTYQPEPARGDAFLIGASTVTTFVFVLTAALWIVGRLSRPLRELATAAGQVGDTGEPQQVIPRGPGDVQQTIHAFNAMSRRVSQLLREKDVMLGALGHDLRTPLSSLRIRLESMEPEAEREKAIRTIEETSVLLDDILDLSSQGRSREPEKSMDLSTLAQDVVEDYGETGAPVTRGEMQRAVAACRPVLLRRAIRNLIDNAIAYGGNARVSVECDADFASLHVEDDGPGMSDAELSSAAEPFFRGESSRNRSTGGAGLGITLVEAIARSHRGELKLQNRTPRGLRASLRIPLIGKGSTGPAAT
jgi:signal transduction histidine kinase